MGQVRRGRRRGLSSGTVTEAGVFVLVPYRNYSLQMLLPCLTWTHCTASPLVPANSSWRKGVLCYQRRTGSRGEGGADRGQRTPPPQSSAMHTETLPPHFQRYSYTTPAPRAADFSIKTLSPWVRASRCRRQCLRRGRILLWSHCGTHRIVHSLESLYCIPMLEVLEPQ